MINKFIVILFSAALTFFGCKSKPGAPNNNTDNTSEFADYYGRTGSKDMYSEHVKDTFRIFTSLPKGYDPGKKYPLIIVLDANTLYEPLIAELKFNTFIGFVPRSIVIGIGYSSFHKMDTLNSRDYTFPKALPEYDMPNSGGAEKFKDFIDKELLPSITKEYSNIDPDRTVLCGHSLGGYFSLFYLLKSASQNNFTIKHFVAASPSLFYNNRYLFEMEKTINPVAISQPVSLYISMGSEEMEEEYTKGILSDFEKQLRNRNYQGLQLKSVEYSNFGHFDAALPGIVKGLSFTLKK